MLEYQNINMNLPLDAQIESLLFFKGQSLSLKAISNTLRTTEDNVREALEILKEKLENRGLQLIINNNEVALVTHAEMSSLIEDLNKEELIKDLSKAALETLSIILYRGPIKRSEVDYIRGVNSQFIIRTLSIRGLITRKQDPNDERAYVYDPSMELLQLLGVGERRELPEYESVEDEIKVFMESQEENENKESDTE